MTLEEAKQRISDLERELADARRPLRLVYVAGKHYDEVILDRDPAGGPRFRTGRRPLVECDNSYPISHGLMTVDFAE